MKEQAEFCKDDGPVVRECPDCIDKYITHAEAIDCERRGLILQEHVSGFDNQHGEPCKCPYCPRVRLSSGSIQTKA